MHRPVAHMTSVYHIVWRTRHFATPPWEEEEGNYHLTWDSNPVTSVYHTVWRTRHFATTPWDSERRKKIISAWAGIQTLSFSSWTECLQMLIQVTYSLWKGTLKPENANRGTLRTNRCKHTHYGMQHWGQDWAQQIRQIWVIIHNLLTLIIYAYLAWFKITCSPHMYCTMENNPEKMTLVTSINLQFKKYCVDFKVWWIFHGDNIQMQVTA